MTNEYPSIATISGLAIQLRRADALARRTSRDHTVRPLTEYVRQAEALHAAGVIVIVPVGV